jgi:hypothetical protein
MDLLQTIKKINIPVPPEHVSELSHTLIDKITFFMREGSKAYKKDTTFQETLLESTEFPKGPDFHYIVEEIRKEIETSVKIGKKYSFMIKERTFTIYAVYPYKTRIGSQKKIYHMLDRSVIKMYIWLYVLSHMAPVECSRELTVYWYATAHKKKLPERGAMDQQHANTGFTQACPTGSNAIYLYRYEEWFKVFIHESFHSFGLDFANMPEKTENLFAIFPVNCDLRFYESYTETWAEIIYMLFTSFVRVYEKGGKRGTQKKTRTTPFETMMENERKFSIFQKVKILRHHHLTYRELCEGKVKYAENTPVFSYYILKSIFMYHYNDFIEWCMKKNRGTFVFKKTQLNVESLIDFVRSKYKEDEYMKSVEDMERWFSKHSATSGSEMQTLRMTIQA